MTLVFMEIARAKIIERSVSSLLAEIKPHLVSKVKN